MKLIEAILSGNAAEASRLIEEKMVDTLKNKLAEAKKIVAAKYGVGELAEEVENLEEASRIKIVKARIRGGKIQRRKKVSAVKGYTLRGGKLVRMSAKERMDRKRGARKAKIKRRAKLSRALMKRKRSLLKRKALGL